MRLLMYFIMVAIYTQLNTNASFWFLAVIGVLFAIVEFGMKYADYEEYNRGYIQGYEDAEKQEKEKH